MIDHREVERIARRMCDERGIDWTKARRNMWLKRAASLPMEPKQSILQRVVRWWKNRGAK